VVEEIGCFRRLRRSLSSLVVEEVALRPSRNHHRQNVPPVTAVGGCGLWLKREGRPPLVPRPPLPGSGAEKVGLEFSSSFQEYEPISLWITGLSVGGL